MNIITVLCLLGIGFANAGFTWINSLDGPPGVQCSVTCGSQVALQGLTIQSSSLNFTSQACAVTSAAGVTQVGTLWYNKNTLSCYVYSNSSDGVPVSVPYSSWFCPCLDRTTLVANITGSTTQSCAASCSQLGAVNGVYYNSSITSCLQPTVQSICYDSIQNSFGYQPARGDQQDCLTVDPPAQTTADTLPAQRGTFFQCLCSDANSTANLQTSSSCRTVPAPAPAQAPVSAQTAAPQSSSVSIGAVVGGAVGGAVAVVLLIVGAIFLVRRRRAARASGTAADKYWVEANKQNAFDTEAQVSPWPPPPLSLLTTMLVSLVLTAVHLQFGTISGDLLEFGALEKGKTTGTLTDITTPSSSLQSRASSMPKSTSDSIANIIGAHQPVQNRPSMR